MAVAVESLPRRDSLPYSEPDRNDTEAYARFPQVFGDVIRMAAKEQGISAKRALRGQGLFLVEYDDSNIVTKVQIAIENGLFTPQLGERALEELRPLRVVPATFHQHRMKQVVHAAGIIGPGE